MSVIAVLIVISLLVAGGFLVAFLWAVKSGQFSDTYTPSVRVLFDDEEIKNQEKDQNEKQENSKNNNKNDK